MKDKIEQSFAQNLNPVLNVTKDGVVLYSNVTGEPLLNSWGVEAGEKLPLNIIDLVQKVIFRNSPEKLGIRVGNKVYLVVFSPLAKQECVIISGFEISNQKEHEETFESEEKYRTIFENSLDAVLLTTPDRTIQAANPAACKLFKMTEDELIQAGRNGILDIPDLRLKPALEERARPDKLIGELNYRRKDGSIFSGEVSHAVFKDKNGVLISAIIIRDATERKQLELEREMSIAFLQLMNESKETTDLIQSVVSFFRKSYDLEAVGIRLKSGDDYPYFESSGFPEEFIKSENSLCTRDNFGKPVYDSAGNPVLECMCGNVICGRFDPSKPFFTSRGSFWTNSTTELLASTTEADRQNRTRNRCNGEGYESVALIALRVGNERLGLLQLYLNIHPLRDDPSSPLFITDRRYNGNYRRLNEQTVNNMLNSLSDKAGIKKNIYPHAFRHGRLTDLAMRGFNEMELRIFAGWTKESNMPATYLHLSGADIEKKILQKNGIIEGDTKEREEKLRPINCPRCKTRNPIGAKYCFTCSMVLDHKLAVEVQDTKTDTIGQLDSSMILEIMNLVKKFNEKS